VKLAAESVHVIAVGRRLHALEQTRSEARSAGLRGEVVPVVADVGTEEGRSAVAREAAARAGGRVRFLVHNAGVLGPLVPLEKLELSKFQDVMRTNVEAPVFLTKALLPLLDAGGAPKPRVLHVSSGCAHNPTASWLAYSVSKAALLMAYRCLELEFREAGRGVLVGSTKPGIIDTPMQDEMRLAADADFPKAKRFRQLKEGLGRKAGAAPPPPTTVERLELPPRFPDPEALDTPENVAHFIWFLLTQTTEEEYGSHDWDVRDKSIASRWAE